MKRGTYILVVGPTGSGKNTLINAAREVMPDLAFAVSATTRAMREGEQDGVNYYFLTKEDFEQKISEGAFVEWAEYGGNYYGTLRAEIESAIAEGKLILSDIEVQGARLIRECMPRGEFAIVFIDAGPWDALVERIKARAPMTDEELEKRRQRFEDEASFKREADYIIENHDGKLEEAKQSFIDVLQKIKG